MLDSKWREFRYQTSKKVLVWMIRQLGEKYETSHGQLNGKMQVYSDIPGDKGVIGTQSYVDSVSNCTWNINREIRRKKESGYVEYINGEPTEEQVSSFSFDDYMPKNFCNYKPNPQNKMTDKWHNKIYAAGLARYTRKYNGLCHLFIHHRWGWEAYSRRMDIATNKFPLHIQKLTEYDEFGVGTILVGEMICKVGITDNLKSVSRIGQSDPDEARRLIVDGEVPEPTFVLFDILFFNNQDLSDFTYDERSAIWKKIGIPPLASNECSLITSVDYYDVNPSNWEGVAKEHEWEGFVIVDGSSKPGDHFYTFSGKPKRPKGTYKLKPVYDADCVVFALSKGSGKRLGKVGSLWLKQRDPDTGKYFNCGKVGSGFSEDDIDLFTQKGEELSLPFVKNAKEADALNLDAKDELVVEIKYYERQEGTNKFQFPVFLRLRNDKAANECIANL